MTLPLVIWSLWLSGTFTQAAAVTLVVIVCLVPLMLLYFYVGRRLDSEAYR